jgi:hypothetical protein
LKGNVYAVPIPNATPAPGAPEPEDADAACDATLAPRANVAGETTAARYANNKDDDDDLKRKSSSKGRSSVGDSENPKDHRRAAAPRERQGEASPHLKLVRSAYERLTGNSWTAADSRVYDENQIADVPADRVVSALEAVSQRTPARVNSFNYFVRAIVASSQPRNRAWHKKQLDRIVRITRDKSVGLADGSLADFVEDVKCACARDGVIFDNDLFNELVG